MRDKINSELLEWIYPKGSHERAAWINGDKNEADFILDAIIICRKSKFDIYSRSVIDTATGAVFYSWIEKGKSISRQWRWGEGWDISEREAYLKAFEWAYRHIFGKFPE